MCETLLKTNSFKEIFKRFSENYFSGLFFAEQLFSKNTPWVLIPNNKYVYIDVSCSLNCIYIYFKLHLNLF